MPPRFHVDRPLGPLPAPGGATGAAQAADGADAPEAPGAAPWALPDGAARHVQVLRLQPGEAIVLFDGRGGEWRARIVAIGRREVTVALDTYLAADRELARPVRLAFGMPANDRMDFLVEKATELGVAGLQPLVCERSVLRLDGERAARKVAHWQAIAIAAAEQSGRTRVPVVAPVCPLARWIGALGPATVERRWLLGFDGAQPLGSVCEPVDAPVLSLSGPEGGLSPAEARAARDAGFATVSLGPRVLRADTAPLALLAAIALGSGG